MGRDDTAARGGHSRPSFALVLVGIGAFAGGIGALSMLRAPAAFADSPPTITQAPPAQGPNRQPSWSFSSTDSPTECELLGPYGVTAFAWASCSSPVSYQLNDLPQGTYTFYAASGAMTGSPPAPDPSDVSTASTYDLQTPSPPLPTLTSTPTSPGSSTSPTWSFTLPGGVFGVTCWVTNSEGVVIEGYTSCTSPYSVDLSTEPDDTYTLSMISVDAAHNTSQTPETSAYQLEVTPPAAPTFTSSPATPSNSTSPEWFFTTPAGTTDTCQVTNSSDTIIDAYAPCTSPETVDLSGQPDDTYTLSVIATDAAGNQSTPATSSYQLDTTAPAAPSFTSTPSTPGNSRSPEWSFTTPAGTTDTCQVTNSSDTVIAPYASCTSPETVDLTGQADDTYTLSVIATDVADNQSSPATSSYQLDTTAPAAPTFTSTPSTPGNSTSPEWFFTTPAGTTDTCQVTNSSDTVIAPYASCTSPEMVDLSGQPDDTYTLSVIATDAASNQSTPATSSYQLLTTPPAAPTFTSTPSTPGNSRSPSWSFTTPAGTTDTCQVTNSSGTVIDAYASCTSPDSVDLTGQPDDTYTLSVIATDAASNQSTPATSSYQLLTTPPAAPTFTSTPSTPGNSRSPSWSFTTPAGTTDTCQVTNSSGTVIDAYASCTSPEAVDLTGQPDDTYTLSVIATDAASNQSSPATSVYQLDTTPPAAPSFTSTPSTPGNSRSPSWSFTSPAGTTDTCRVTNSSGTVIDAYASCTSPESVDLTGQPDDTYTLSVIATDAAGNQSTPATSSYRLLTTPPAAPTFTSTPSTPGNSRSPSWSFTSPAGTTDTCQVTNSSGTVIDAYASCTSPESVDLTGQPDDTYTLSVIATDAAGNQSTPATSSYRLLTTPPAAPTVSGGPASGSTNSLSWSFTSPAGTTTTCQLTGPGGAVLSPWAPCTSPATFSVSGSPGTYTLSLRATDAAGNVSSDGTSTFAIPTPAPAPTPAAPSPAPPATPPAASPQPTPTPIAPPGPALPVIPPPVPVVPVPAPFSPPIPSLPVIVPPTPLPAVVTPLALAPDPAPRLLVPTHPAAPAPAPPVAVTPPPRRPAPPGPASPSTVAAVLAAVSKATVAVSEGGAAAVLMYLLLVGFLAVQDRIDRNDPKLALAPVFAEPDLPFENPSSPGDEIL